MIRGLALCAGVGGLELGLRLALGDAYRCVGYVERDAFAAALLVARMADQALDRAPVWDDLQTFDGRPWRRRLDLVSAGFPCQPASSAGRRRGTDDARWLWPHIARVVRAADPRLVFVENVPGLLTVNGGEAFGEVVEDLAALGFDAEWDVFSAAEVGAPHLRERLFLLAYRHGEHGGIGDGAVAAGRAVVEAVPSRTSSASHRRDVAHRHSDGRTGVWRGGLHDGERPAPGHDADGRRRTNVANSGGAGDGPHARSSSHRAGDDGGRPAPVGDQPGGGLSTLVVVEGGGRRVPGLDNGPWAGRRDARLGNPNFGHVAVGGRDAPAAPFPPGPAARDAWAAVLAQQPDLAPALEPAVRGAADGLAVTDHPNAATGDQVKPSH